MKKKLVNQNVETETFISIDLRLQMISTVLITWSQCCIIYQTLLLIARQQERGRRYFTEVYVYVYKTHIVTNMKQRLISKDIRQ